LFAACDVLQSMICEGKNELLDEDEEEETSFITPNVYKSKSLGSSSILGKYSERIVIELFSGA